MDGGLGERLRSAITGVNDELELEQAELVANYVERVKDVNESDLQGAIIEAARLCGWRVAHFRPARTAHGWRTPVAADGAGFPDLVLVRERVVFVELKGDGGRLRPEQQGWLDALGRGGQECYVWTPSSWMSGDVDTALKPV